MGSREPRAPQRMCLACRQRGPQAAFARIHGGADGRVRVDGPTRSGGRGAYVCASETCVERAVEAKALARALRLTQPPSREEIQVLRETLTARVRAWETAAEQGSSEDGG